MKKFNLIILTGIFFFALSACGSGKSDEEKAEDMAENILETMTGGDVDIDVDKDGKNGEITIKGKDGEEVTFSSNENELPDDFPSDVYVIDGEKQGVGNMTSNDGQVVTFGVKSDEDFSDVKETILKEMKSNGWENTMTMGAGEESMQMYTKDEKSATITLSKEDDKTVVAYMVTYKK
ncbi:MAG: hypothetical protein ABFS35_04930 [Bacteroidota bacterium]